MRIAGELNCFKQIFLCRSSNKFVNITWLKGLKVNIKGHICDPEFFTSQDLAILFLVLKLSRVWGIYF